MYVRNPERAQSEAEPFSGFAQGGRYAGVNAMQSVGTFNTISVYQDRQPRGRR